jgi:hypothetical protein
VPRASRRLDGSGGSGGGGGEVLLMLEELEEEEEEEPWVPSCALSLLIVACEGKEV